jgi:hypothetical protein
LSRDEAGAATDRILAFSALLLESFGGIADNRRSMIFRLHHRRSRLLSPALALGFMIAMLSPALADAADPAVPADELLREAVAREKPNFNDGYLAWTDRVQRPRGSVTKLMVNTPQGILSRVIAINDQALSADERQQDDARINRLLDPQKMRDKLKKQQEDKQHVEHLLRALPDALHCDYSPAEPQDGTLRLECSPNPSFSPPNYESQLLVGMKAEIAIDRQEKRITRVAGTLFKDVTFGWGFLARLRSGGRIEIAQSRVAGKRWGVTHMQLTFDGHLVMVKPLHIEESESCWNYRSVPGMTVAQALEFLRNSPASPAH